jgi:sugar (pentulose or hexulose) kinase
MGVASSSDGEVCILAVDAGTSVIKAVLFDRRLRPLGVGRRRMRPLAPEPGWSEVDMETVWQDATAAIRDAVTAAGVAPGRIRGIGVSGCMVGAWLIDRAGRPVRNAILWNDARTQPLIDRLEALHPTFMHDIFVCSGSVMQQGCTLPLLRWLAEEEPQSLGRAAAVLGAKDWLRYRMTGSIASDPSESSVAPGDAGARGRSERAIDLLGLRSWRHLLPAVQPCEAIAGRLTVDAAAATGLAAGTPVVTGAGDVAASALGSGSVHPGDACIILGTTCLCCLVVDRPVLDPPDLGLLFCLPGGRWLRAMVNVAGTISLDWALARLKLAEQGDTPYRTAETLAAASPPGARGLLYLPYLGSVGIIAPFVEPRARGCLVGLADDHDDADILRAVYEGIALSIRDCLDAMPERPATLRLIGGGARSAFLAQLVADACDRPVVTLSIEETGARGAALLAAHALGWTGTLADDPGLAPLDERLFRPRPGLVPLYAASLARYRFLTRALRPWWRSDAGRSIDL